MSTCSEATSRFLDLHRVAPLGKDLSALGAIQAAFAALPWENLSKYLAKHDGGREAELGSIPIALRDRPHLARLRMPAEVMDDHARWGTGGTCFSLTQLLRTILEDLGWTCHPAMADMRHGANIHCGLVVICEGRRWLLDPGYLVAEPVPLDPGTEQRILLPGHRLCYLPDGKGGVELFTENDRGERTWRYRLRSDPVGDEAFFEHWLESFEDSGMNGLHANRFVGSARLSAHDQNLRIDTGTGKRNVKLKEGWAEGMAEHFHLDRAFAARVHDAWKERRCLGR